MVLQILFLDISSLEFKMSKSSAYLEPVCLSVPKSSIIKRICQKFIQLSAFSRSSSSCEYLEAMLSNKSEHSCIPLEFLSISAIAMQLHKSFKTCFPYKYKIVCLFCMKVPYKFLASCKIFTEFHAELFALYLSTSGSAGYKSRS